MVLSALRPSLSSAVLALQSLSDSYVFFGYVDQLLLGEELAGAGVTPVLDYFARDVELGLAAPLWVVRDASARQSRRFPQLSPLPLKNNRLGRFAFPGDLLYISAFCRAHTARHGAYTVFEGKAGYLCRTRRGGKFFRAKTGCQSCPVQRAPPNTDRSLLRGRAALAAIKHSAASYRPRGRPP